MRPGFIGPLGSALVAIAAALLIACSSRVDNSQVRLPVPVQSTTLGPGDLFNLEIVGEKELPREYQVASDGTVDIPYIHRLTVSGLEPQELAERVRQALVEARILHDPSVVVSVKEYKSKRVSVLGEVRQPGSFALATGMTLVQALSQAGGLSPIADSTRITLTRQAGGSTTTVSLNFDSITEGRSPDIPLQAGDRIFIRQRVF
jgi:protein involved in polysaccharide export with SLBB domain